MVDGSVAVDAAGDDTGDDDELLVLMTAPLKRWKSFGR
jgi:hypothetical protein